MYHLATADGLPVEYTHILNRMQPVHIVDVKAKMDPLAVVYLHVLQGVFPNDPEAGQPRGGPHLHIV